MDRVLANGSMCFFVHFLNLNKEETNIQTRLHVLGFVFLNTCPTKSLFYPHKTYEIQLFAQLPEYVKRNNCVTAELSISHCAASECRSAGDKCPTKIALSKSDSELQSLINPF